VGVVYLPLLYGALFNLKRHTNIPTLMSRGTCCCFKIIWSENLLQGDDGPITVHPKYREFRPDLSEQFIPKTFIFTVTLSAQLYIHLTGISSSGREVRQINDLFWSHNCILIVSLMVIQVFFF
jgi:hypothetical protein